MRLKITLSEFWSQLKNNSFKTWIDKLSFKAIFVVWVLSIILFACIYHLFSGQESYLYYAHYEHVVTSFAQAVYFSFITATTTGYGDIVPLGYFKIISIAEVLFGLLLLAIVTSKLISIKQDVILTEIYDISFKERVNRLRSSLFKFRHNISNITRKARDNTLKETDLGQLYIFLYSFEDTLNEILILHKRSGQYYFLKKVGILSSEVILKSIINSFDKLEEMIIELNKTKNEEWHNDLNLRLIKTCVDLAEQIFENFLYEKAFEKKTTQWMKQEIAEKLKSIRKQLQFEN